MYMFVYFLCIHITLRKERKVAHLGFVDFLSQQACGFEYTSKLQRMFQDIGVSKDLNDKFKSHLANTEALDCKSIVFNCCGYVRVMPCCCFFVCDV